MNKPSFTRGPWEILDSTKMSEQEYDELLVSQEYATLETIWDGKILIAAACAWNDEIPDKTLNANAHLIAAAPSLYSELERLDPSNPVLAIARGEA